MKRRNRMFITLASAAVLAVSATAVPAVGSDGATAAGEIEVAGLVENGQGAHLPVFPASNGNGTFDGTVVSGEAAGQDPLGQPWSAAFSGGEVTAEFTYNEPAATCPLEGTADGDVWIHVGGVHGGVVVGNYGASASVSAIWVHAHFTWERTGVTAVVTLSDVDVTLELDGSTTRTVVNGDPSEEDGTAVASFVPHDSTDDPCDGSSIDADVVADAVLAHS